jgi:hypothetical protein
MNIDQLKAVHPSYKEIAKQSNYYYQSFMGGNIYRNGYHLTRYLDESNDSNDGYSKRLISTPLDNHVQTTVDIYRSFLFRDLPSRELGFLLDNPLVQEWVNDTDNEGQSMNSFLKTANDLAMVMGSVWILVDKPTYKVETAAQEIELGLRAYACAYSPQNVLDWKYSRNIAGKMILEHIKVIEHENDSTVTMNVWSPEYMTKFVISKDEQGHWEDVMSVEEYENPLGYIPFVFHAPIRTATKGVGQSLVADVADQQRYIYNLLSELEQTVRISGHPTLVKTPSTDANAGAGSIVTVTEDLDPGLKPYLLQPNSQGITGILSTIESCVESIHRMTHTSAIQAKRGQAISGIALQTERQLLNAKLSDISDTLRETELSMWKIWFDWQGINRPEDFDVIYPDSFDIRDRGVELEYMLKSRSSGVANEMYQKEIDKQIVMLTIDDDYAQNMIITDLEEGYKPKPMVNRADGQTIVANTAEEEAQLTSIGYVYLGN